MRLAYCDYIAMVIRNALEADIVSNLWTHVGSVSRINWDLNTDGSFRSTKKTLTVTDNNGKVYIVTIEEK